MLSQKHYYMTSVVTFSPRYVLCNRLGDSAAARVGARASLAPIPALLVKQEDTDEIITLAPGVSVPFHWTDSAAPKHILVGVACEAIGGVWWSGPLDIDRLGESPVRLRKVRTTAPLALFVLICALDCLFVCAMLLILWCVCVAW